MDLARAGSLYMQLAQISFICAGLFSDLLLVRLFLVSGYLWLMLNTALGWPSWGEFVSDGPLVVGIDGLCWSLIGMYLQLSSLIKLMFDEREIKFNHDEECLWGMFYRTGGLSRLVFKKTVLENGKFERYQPGELIMDNDQQPGKNICILIEGIVDAQISKGDEKQVLPLGSGDIFNFKYLNLIGVYVGFFDNNLVANAQTECLVFSIPDANMEKMQHSASAKAAWQSLIIMAVGRACERPYSNMKPEFRDPIFSPLTAAEYPPQHSGGECLKSPFKNLFKLMYNSFTYPWPFEAPLTGLRHQIHIPLSGKRAAEMVKKEETESFILKNDDDHEISIA